MFKAIQNKEKKIAIIGLGYVGLPLALEFAKKFSVIGFDINQQRVDMMKNRIDPSEELVAEDFDNKDDDQDQDDNNNDNGGECSKTAGSWIPTVGG